jgi:hypothetical protein
MNLRATFAAFFASYLFLASCHAEEQLRRRELVAPDNWSSNSSPADAFGLTFARNAGTGESNDNVCDEFVGCDNPDYECYCECVTTPAICNGNYSQLGNDIDGEAADDRSGFSVSLSGDGTIVAIGAILNDAVNDTDSGHVRVFKWNGTARNQLGDDINGEAAGDQSGSSVSLSHDGTIVAIGAPRNDGVYGVDSGHVRVLKWNGAAWNQLGNDIDGEAAGDLSGFSVALSSDGMIVAIGALRNDGINGVDSGHVRVFKWNGAAWNQLGNDIDGEAELDLSGYSVSLSSDGMIVAVGATDNDGVNGTDSGHVRVFKWNGAAWNQLGDDIDGEAESDFSGDFIPLSGDGTIVAIGATDNDGVNGVDSGHVRVFKWNGAAWNQLGNDIDGEAEFDISGFSVALSSDGTIAAIGAIFSVDVNGTDSGHVRVFKWNGTAWNQLGNDIDGEAAGDRSGFSVALSSDGSIVASGAPRNDGVNGIDSGNVRIYSCT